LPGPQAGTRHIQNVKTLMDVAAMPASLEIVLSVADACVLGARFEKVESSREPSERSLEAVQCSVFNVQCSMFILADDRANASGTGSITLLVAFDATPVLFQCSTKPLPRNSSDLVALPSEWQCLAVAFR
jgi:hypothetical protein